MFAAQFIRFRVWLTKIFFRTHASWLNQFQRQIMKEWIYYSAQRCKSHNISPEVVTISLCPPQTTIAYMDIKYRRSTFTIKIINEANTNLINSFGASRPPFKLESLIVRSWNQTHNSAGYHGVIHREQKRWFENKIARMVAFEWSVRLKNALTIVQFFWASIVRHSGRTRLHFHFFLPPVLFAFFSSSLICFHWIHSYFLVGCVV